MIKIVPMERKLPSDYAVAASVGFIMSLFLVKCKLRCDNEHAVSALCSKIEAEMPDRISLENTFAFEPEQPSRGGNSSSGKLDHSA